MDEWMDECLGTKDWIHEMRNEFKINEQMEDDKRMDGLVG